MRAVFEFSGFLGVSVAAHLALWQGVPGGAPMATGAEGGAEVTLAGGDRRLQALVAAWDTPPETSAVMAAMEPPAVDLETATPPESEAPHQALPRPVRPGQPAAPLAAPVAPALAEIATVPSEPGRGLAPLASPRPQPRPERQVARTVPQPAPAAKPKRAARPKPAAPGAQAAGNGGRRAAGTTRPAAAPAKGAKKPSASQMARWGGTIRARVEQRKRYPGGATGNGRVRLWLKVTTNGKLAGAGISRSSGNAAFDRAALKAVRRAALPRAPKGMAAGAYRFTLTMTFTR